MTLGAIKILRIEIDCHFHGSSDVPRPWVARIDGIDRKYGLARTFVERLNDYRQATYKPARARLRGVVAAFPLRDGHVYEICRLRGKSSKRHVAREFVRVADNDLLEIDPIEALRLAEGHDFPVIEHRAPDFAEVAVVRGLGSPELLGFVVVDGQRAFRLLDGAIHEITHNGERRLVHATGGGLRNVTQREALAVLATQDIP